MAHGVGRALDFMGGHAGRRPCGRLGAGAPCRAGGIPARHPAAAGRPADLLRWGAYVAIAAAVVSLAGLVVTLTRPKEARRGILLAAVSLLAGVVLDRAFLAAFAWVRQRLRFTTSPPTRRNLPSTSPCCRSARTRPTPRCTAERKSRRSSARPIRIFSR